MLAQVIGAGIGGIGGILNAYAENQRKMEQSRVEEHYNRTAGAQLARAAEANQNLNPAAMANRSRQDVNATMSGAIGAAANAAAGQTASSGDFGNAQGNAATMTQATTAAAAPYAQQLAGINQSQYQGQADKIRQAESIANSTANLSNHVNYLMQERNNANPLGSALIQGLGGVLGGANTGESLAGALFNTKDKQSGNTPQSQPQSAPTIYTPGRNEVQRMMGPAPSSEGLDTNFGDTSGFDPLGEQSPSLQFQQPAQARPRIGGFTPFNMAQSLVQGYSPINNFLNRTRSSRSTNI